MGKQKLNSILDTLYESEKALLNGGYIRSTNIVGELGEYYAAQAYGLHRTHRSGQKDYDLNDSNGKCYQVKTRRPYQHQERISKPNGRIQGLDKGSCDVIIVELDYKYRCKLIFSVSRKKVNELLAGKSHLILRKLYRDADDPLEKVQR